MFRRIRPLAFPVLVWPELAYRNRAWPEPVWQVSVLPELEFPPPV